MELSVTNNNRIAWSLSEISTVTGLSVNFLRYEVRRGNLAIRRFGRRVLVRDEDLRSYIANGSDGSQKSTGCEG